MLFSLLVVCSLPLAAALPAEWSVPEADARIPLAITGDLYARESLPCEVVIDFNALLGADRSLAADGLTLVDVATGEVVALQVAQDAQIRYASGNPILRLRWASGPLDPFARRTWQLYLRTVSPGAADAWTALDQTFVPSPANVLLETSFEEPSPERPTVPMYMVEGGMDVEGETTERIWTDDEARSGARALKIARVFADGPPANTNRPHWRTWPPPVQVRPGQSLRLCAWVKAAELGEGGLVSVMLEFYGPGNERLSEGRLWLRAPQQPSDWTELTGSTTAPAGAAGAVFWFSLHNEGMAWCDDVRIEAVPGGELPRLEVAVGALEDRAAFAAAQGERPAGKVLFAGVAPQPPVIDGALDDECWQSAGRADDFAVHARVPGTAVSTTVLACADGDALYFGFECTEPATDGLLAAATERDGRLWEDDSVELFLDTNRDRETYYQIIVNSRGVIFDQDTGAPGLSGAKWDGPVTAAARVLPDRWTAEVRLEFAGLRLAQAEGRVWGINFARSSFCDGRSLYVWAPVGSNFGEPARFGELVLPFDPTADVVTGRPLGGQRIFYGSGLLRFEVTNRRDRPVTVRLSALEEADKPRVLGGVRQTVTAASGAELALPASFPRPGEVRVRYDLAEAESGRLLYTTSVAHTVPEPLTLEPAALVSWLGEDRLSVSWELGLSGDALADVVLALRVLPAGGGEPLASADVSPSATAGMSWVPVGDLPSGSYLLRAALVRGAETLGVTSFRFRRARGPFSPAQ
ncbi:MAG: sugar-binding protein [Armatimonadota bacterium]